MRSGKVLKLCMKSVQPAGVELGLVMIRLSLDFAAICRGNLAVV
jgi:hypothetical protein